MFEHAWLVDPQGTSWETTWTDRGDIHYIGLTFDLSQLIEMLEESDEPLLFGDWDRGWRLLRSHNKCCARPSATT